MGNLRKTQQHLLPVQKTTTEKGHYDIYPAFRLENNKISSGFEQLAFEFSKYSLVLMDGYQGVFFEQLRYALEPFFNSSGLRVQWTDFRLAYLLSEEIETMTEPFLGGDDPLFGYKTTLTMADFVDKEKLLKIKTAPGIDLHIIYGPGAALYAEKGLLFYTDIPKNEIQFRSRAGSITNLGSEVPCDPKKMYKRSYFVDWVVLNKHKQEILPRIDIVADCQRPNEITWSFGEVIRNGLHHMSRNFFRVRPWFEPGIWGGNWIKDQIKGLNEEVPNYGWSFELIVPENGILFESSGFLLEISFDCLMFLEAAAVLGDAYDQFGNEFPIRFDFLDTVDGGNLSVQCHPQTEYIQKHFNENFTQEECYYILDNKPGSVVYLGFQEDIEPISFQQALTNSFIQARALDIEQFVRKLPSSKHDFFLIPPGTIHGSGKDNLVLEISSTPYIYTFKMYDWLRPDLDGKPRPLNIKRGMENLCFDRKGTYVDENLVSKPVLLESNEAYSIYHLPTHSKHSYDVHRLHLKSRAKLTTGNKAMVMNLVEGSCITLITENGLEQTFNYAETFVIPAAAGHFTLLNEDELEAVIVMAFIK
ncbi:MAG TPA: hypothetical protein DCX89_05405 [Saprospirales bacterium]|nr:hypothetical protein [Saprospirales bacterium]HRQ28727.1 class I mannose-6-phosphate isomerase [Saprospiraceae bacterium]